MAKRFTDTDKWEDSFFFDLPAKFKLVWFYLLDKCDNAGIIEFNERIFSFYIGEKITSEEIINVFGDRIYVTEKGNWYIKNFVSFQYKSLSEDSKPQKSALEKLKKEGVPIEFYNSSITLNKPLDKGYLTLQDKDMDKELDKDKELEGGLCYDDKHKDFDKLCLMFPEGKRNYDPHSLTIWENLSTRDKELCLQLTPHYVEYQTKNGKSQYIKNIKKFLEEGFYKQLNEFQSRYLGKKVIVNSLDGKRKTKEEQDEELRKELWGS
jgi:hypothetical protein